MEQKRIITRYSNAVSVKSHNKRFTIIEKDNENVLLEFLIVGDKKDVDVPRSHHSTVKGRITSTQILIQVERIQDMIDALSAYQEKMIFKKISKDWEKLTDNSITFIYTNEK